MAIALRAERVALGCLVVCALGGCNVIFGLEQSFPLDGEGGSTATGAGGSGGAVGRGGGVTTTATTTSSETTSGASSSAAGGTGGAPGTASGGSGGTSSSTAVSSSSSSTSGSGGGMVCSPGSQLSCYDGPPGTENKGICMSGTKTCNPQGTGYGSCIGQTLPGVESCLTQVDDDCDGTINEGCGNQTCNLYSESFDDGKASDATVGFYKLQWCDTYVPNASNTPLCMSGQTLRTNSSSQDPTMWIYQGNAGCTQAKVSFTYYQFTSANVSVEYQASGDVVHSCEKAGAFTSLLGPSATQQCVMETVTVPFNNLKSAYVRFEHGSGSNALWVDSISIVLEGCAC